MKRLSAWSKQHPRFARSLIAGGRIVLAIQGFGLGLVLTSYGIEWTAGLTWGAGGAFLIAALGYPARRSGRARLAAYSRQKACDALLVASSWLVYVCLGQTLSQPALAPALPLQSSGVAHTAWSSLESKGSWLTWENRSKVLKKAQKSTRQAVKEIRAARRNLSTSAVIGLTLLSILIVLGLGYLVVGLSCRLSCNGQEGAAVLVALLGATGIVLLLLAIWRGAARAARRKAARVGKPAE